MEDIAFVVLDLETTGLEAENHLILEAAVIPIHFDTAEPMKPEKRAETLNVVVGHSFHDSIMSDFVRDMHTSSGLLQLVRESPDCLSHATLDTVLADYLAGIANGRKVQLVGNSVHFDRRFLEERCPKTYAMLHHRNCDVSTFRTMYERWVGEPPEQDKVHRAMADCEMSLRSLQWARRTLWSSRGCSVCGRPATLCPDCSYNGEI